MKLRNLFRKKRKKIVCISFPKSGRTWVRFALNAAGAEVEFTHAGYGTRKQDEFGSEFSGLKSEFFGSRNIFLYRNALDTAVSMFHQIQNRNFNPESSGFDEKHKKLLNQNLLPPVEIDDFILHPIWGCPKIFAYNAAHMEYFAGSENNKIVRYEDLRQDPETHFSELLNFLQLKTYDIDHVVGESSFENMRSLELNGGETQQKQHKLYGLKNNDVNTLKVRRGKVRGYVDVLKPETIEATRVICAEFGRVSTLLAGEKD